MTAKDHINMLNIKSTFDHAFSSGMHDKRKLSLSYAALGVLESESLILHKIGAGMAEARGVDKKHATKQVDRLLSTQPMIFGIYLTFGFLMLLAVKKKLQLL